MNPEILKYILSQRISVFAIEMMDGSPHASTLHYAYDEKINTFIFETEKSYRKCESLFGRKISRATLVIGTNEGDMRTFQADGNAQLLNNDDLKEVYLTKFPKNRDGADDPGVVFFTFTPAVWKFSDYTKSGSKTVYTSDGKVNTEEY